VDFSLDLGPGETYFVTETVTVDQTTMNTATWTATDGVETVSDFDSATVTVEPPVPVIDVDPDAVTSTQAPDAVITQTLTVSNIGTGDLDWSIIEAGRPAPPYTPPAAGSAQAGSLLETAAANPSGTRTVGPNAAPDAVILDQQPSQVNGFFNDVSCDLCAGGAQSIAENFSLSGSETIGQVVFWSGYFPTDTPIDPDTITVIFHNDAAGLPGTAVYTEANVAYDRVQTGVILFGVHEWMHTLTLASPVTLGPGNYWVEIFNDTGFAGFDFFWETGFPDTVGNGLPGSAFAFETPGTGWNFDVVNDLAVQLVTVAGGGTCSTPEDIPWASADPTSDTTGPGGASDVTVTFDSTGLSTGTYTGTLCIDSNDPVTPQVQVPIDLTVDPAGAPVIEVSPSTLESTQAPDTVVTDTLTVSNVGGGVLDWTIDEAAAQVSVPPELLVKAPATDNISSPEIPGVPAPAAGSQVETFLAPDVVLYDNGPLSIARAVELAARIQARCRLHWG
jgi:hypothetical protein